ncbi:MAG: ABC transporter permease [Acidobacteriota bacterium]|nr:ABC transporter permease [Acidobacteriota bacterium]
MEELWQDLRYALRALVKRPGFTLIAIPSLALAIGANTVIFALVDAVLLHPLPVAGLSRLMTLQTRIPESPGYFGVSYPNFADFRDHATVFSHLVGTVGVQVSLAGRTEPEQIPGEMVSGDYFDALGVPAALGRTFLPDEDRVPGAHPVVVLSHSLWQRRFGADRSVVGRVVQLNGQSFTVIGVAPAGFSGSGILTPSEVWVPATMYQQVLPANLLPLFKLRKVGLLGVIGRLRPGVSPEQAEAACKALALNLAREYPSDNAKRTVSLLPLSQSTIDPNSRGGYLEAGVLLMSTVGLILLIACANLANMLLVRASERRPEVAIRLALGVQRGRLVRQLLTESLLLALIAGAAGLLLAVWSRGLIALFRSSYLPPTLHVELDARILVFTLVLSLLSGLLFGLAPALRLSRPDLTTGLKSRAGAEASGGRGLGLRNILVAGQVGLSLLALVGAVLLLVSLRNVEHIDPGFERRHLLVLSLDLASQKLDEARGEQFLGEVIRRVEALPQVRSAALAENLVLVDQGVRHRIQPEGREARGGGEAEALIVQTCAISPGYFRTLGVQVLRGRAFNDSDLPGSRQVVIVNRTMADRLWPQQDPIGRRFKMQPTLQTFEVVGVAQDVKYNALGEEPQLYVYLPLPQSYSPGVTLHVLTAGEPALLVNTLRKRLQEMAPTLPLFRIKTMPEVIDDQLWAWRAGALLLSLFGCVALLLVIIGIYGVISYSIAQRKREIGIRVALGATRPQLIRLFVRQGMAMVAIGLALGLLSALSATRLIADLLYGIDAADPRTLGATALLLGAVGLAANYLPARRAAAVPPMLVMRQE